VWSPQQWHFTSRRCGFESRPQDGYVLFRTSYTTRRAMYIQRNTVARSRNVYTSSDFLTAWYHFIRSKHFYCELMSPATIKRTLVFMWSARYFSPIITKFATASHIFNEVDNTKSYVNRPAGGTLTHADRRTDMTRVIIGALCNLRTRLKCFDTRRREGIIAWVW
jgi:hypothetical protein